MALNSIARLAIHITTETAGMVTGFKKAQVETAQFANRVDGTRGRLTQLTMSTISASHALGRMSGVIASAVGSAGPYGAAAAAIVALTALTISAMLKVAEVADKARAFRIETLREYAKAMDAVHGGKMAVHAEALTTTTEQMKLLKQEFIDMAEASGLSLTGMTKMGRLLADAFGRAVFGDEKMNAINRTNKATAALIEKTKELKDIEEQRRKSFDSEISEIERDFRSTVESMKRRGEQLEQSFRTPLEKLKDSLIELNQLRQGGFIGDETLSRGLRQAADDYRKALMDAKSKPPQTTGAAEVGTTAGYSALVRGQLQMHTQAAMLKVEEQQLEAIRQVRAAVLGQDTVRFKVANLPP